MKWAILLVAGGIGLIFFGSNLASIGDQVDATLQSKWFAWGLVIAGGFLAYSNSGHFKRLSA